MKCNPGATRKTGIIYIAKNIVNGKCYVGQTLGTLKSRIRQHKNRAFPRKGEPSSHLFHRAIRKYGLNMFQWSVVETCQQQKLNDKEIYYIKLYNSYAPESKMGYNMTCGGDNHFGSSGKYHYLKQMSLTEKKRWSEKHRIGNSNPNFENPNLSGANHFSKKMTEEEYSQWVSKISGKNNYQKLLTPKKRKAKCWINKLSKKDHKEWIKNNLSGKNNPFYKASKKNPEKYRGKNNVLYGVPNIKARKAYVITFPDGSEQTIIGIIDFCKKHNLNSGNMLSCASGKQKQCKGFKCRRVNQDCC